MSATPAQRRSIFQMVLVSMAIFALSFWGRVNADRDEAEAAEAAAAAAANTPPPAPTDRAPKTLSPGARTLIPRPVITRPVITRPVITRTGAPSDEPPDGEPAEPPPPDAPVTREDLRAAIQTSIADIMPAVEDCLRGWWMLDPALQGEVMMSFQLGPEGIDAVEILDHSDVPIGPLSCFGAALYHGDWPQMEGDFEFPFTFGD